MLRHVLTFSALNILQRSKLFNVRQYALLSEAFKSTMEIQLEPPVVDRQLKKSFGQKNNNLMPFELEAFIASLIKNKDTTADRRDEVNEKLLELRKSTALMPKTLNHCVVNFLLTVSADDLLAVLAEKMRFGIFIDAFTGCYLMDNFLEQKDYKKAVHIAAELMIQEDQHNLVQAFSLLSAFQFVQHKIKENDWATLQNVAENDNNDEVKKSNEKGVKIRVKFLRNPIENEMLNISNIDTKLLAKLFVNCSRGLSNELIKSNSLLLANVINGDFKQAEQLSTNDKSLLCKDVAELSLEILKTFNEAESETQKLNIILEEVKESSKSSNYFDTLNEFLQSSLKSIETDFIAEQKNLQQVWLKERALQLENIIKNEERLQREETVKQDLQNIEEKRQKLWFFENQDKLDMEIFRKQVRYPKRWFGKKKKPRTVDDNYVPPDIRTEFRN